MAHNLMCRNGRAAMAYYGERPWHGLGVELAGPATAAEAIKAAQLDWEVALRPVYVRNPEDSAPAVPGAPLGPFAEVEGYRATVALLGGGADPVLGVVSARYAPVQNADAFGFFDSVVGEGKALYHTAGALGRGERVWILAKLPGVIEPVPGDVTEKFLVLMNCHDGTGALKMFFTPVRVVCQNTWVAAEKGAAGEGISIRHVGDVMAKVEAAKRALGLAVEYYGRLEGKATALAAHKMAVAEIEEYLTALFPDGSLSPAAVEDARIAVGSLAQGGRGQRGVPAVQGTAWAYLQGAVEYADYHRRGMSEKSDPSRRLASCWYGSGAQFKARAFDLLAAMAGAAN